MEINGFKKGVLVGFRLSKELNRFSSTNLDL